jgi:crotonobetainyl-CoA:carnitine CoA-transferase CaiB-like acyl-CoA transferase
LSYDTVRSWNPAIVYVTMSGCGHEGPWSKLVTYAPTIHALSGLTYLSNPPGRGDVGPGFSLNDHAVGFAAAVAMLAALEARERTGEGQHVDISQMETGAYLLGPAVLDYLTNGHEAQPAGNADPFGQLVPNECYRTSDGRWLAVTCRTDAEWSRLVEATGIPADPALATVAGRHAAVEEVDALLAAWVATTTADGAQELLQGIGVPAGKIQDGSDLMADPQLNARSMWRTFDHAVFGTRPYDRFPAIWSHSNLEPYLPSPSYVGEHNFEVYPEVAGLSEDEVAEGLGEGLFS